MVFCVDRVGFVGEDGEIYYGSFDILYLSLILNLILMVLKDIKEFEMMLEFAVFY